MKKKKKKKKMKKTRKGRIKHLHRYYLCRGLTSLE